MPFAYHAYFWYTPHMSLSVGIVGLPNVGKSTLFNALTNKGVLIANYPFATIDPSVGVVEVPDSRLQVLAQISNTQKIIPAIIEFVDIAGLVRGAASGEGLGNAFLANIRETDMIAEVVRIFEDEDTHHVHGRIDPMDDIEVINLELILADQEVVGKRLGNVERDVKRGMKEAQLEHGALLKISQALQAGKFANTADLSKEETPFVRQLNLLTMKPVLYVCNKRAGAFNLDEQNDERWQTFEAFVDAQGAQYVVIDAGIEHDLKDLHEDDKLEFRREYGAQDSGIDSMIRACYNLLGLESYLTTGEKETRAWTFKRGSTAPVAAAAIHSDFEKKFIRAQVVAYLDLVQAGSLAAARDTGKLRTEGKDYIVKDGDVIEFLIGQ